jgi:hypothetical protein
MRRRLDEVETNLNAWRTQGIGDLLVPGSQAVGQTVGGVVRWLDLSLDTYTIDDDTEDVLYLVNVPAGQFTPPRMVQIDVAGRIRNFKGSAGTLTFDVTLDNTIVWQDGLSIPNDTDAAGFYWRVLVATEAVDQQSVGGCLIIGPQLTATAGYGDIDYSSVSPHAATGFSASATNATYNNDLSIFLDLTFSVADPDFLVVRNFASALII